MSEEIIEAGRIKISATFSRAVSDGNYGTIKAEAWVQGDVPSDAKPDEITEASTVLLQTAAVAVWDQLGIKYNVDEVTGLLTEETPAPKASQPAQLGGGGAPQSSGGGSVRVMNPNDQQGDLPAWLIAACEKDGVTAVWDQRKTATGRQPHFKEAVARGAVGHGKDGAAKGYWPPN